VCKRFTYVHTHKQIHTNIKQKTQTGTNKQTQNKNTKVTTCNIQGEQKQTLQRRVERKGCLMDREEEVRRKPKWADM